MSNRTIIQLCRNGSPLEVKKILEEPYFDINQTFETWVEGCGTIECLLTVSMNNSDVLQLILNDGSLDIDKIVQKYETMESG